MVEQIQRVVKMKNIVQLPFQTALVVNNIDILENKILYFRSSVLIFIYFHSIALPMHRNLPYQVSLLHRRLAQHRPISTFERSNLKSSNCSFIQFNITIRSYILLKL